MHHINNKYHLLVTISLILVFILFNNCISNNSKLKIENRTIGIKVNMACLNTPLELDEFKQSVVQSLKPPSSGVIFWSWEQLEEQPDKKNVLKELIKNL